VREKYCWLVADKPSEQACLLDRASKYIRDTFCGRLNKIKFDHGNC
jgi:hypothetical protein